MEIRIKFSEEYLEKMTDVDAISEGDGNQLRKFATLLSITLLKRVFKDVDVLEINVDDIEDEKALSVFNDNIAGIASVAVSCTDIKKEK